MLPWLKQALKPCVLVSLVHINGKGIAQQATSMLQLHVVIHVIGAAAFGHPCQFVEQTVDSKSKTAR